MLSYTVFGICSMNKNNSDNFLVSTSPSLLMFYDFMKHLISPRTLFVSLIEIGDKSHCGY